MENFSKFYPELQNALVDIIDAIDSSLRSGGYQGEPVRMYLAGGLAVNFYCGTRYTEDVDAYFSKRLILPKEGLEVSYERRDDGEIGLLYFDRQYNPTLGLEHPNAEKDALELSEINEQGRLINLYVLSPVDLAVSKIEMLSENDYSDILTLAEQGYFTAEQLSARCREALAMYAGNDAEILKTLEGLTRKIEELNPEDDQGFEMAP